MFSLAVAATQGHTNYVAICYCQIHEEKQTTAMLHENVWNCNQQEVIADNLPNYKNYLFRMEPKDSGWPQVNKVRGYLWNLRRFEASMMYDAYDVLDFVSDHMAFPGFALSAS